MTSEVLKMHQKNILKSIFISSLNNKNSTSEYLSEQLMVSSDYLVKSCNDLSKIGMISKKDDKWFLTELGRSQLTVVFVGGVFDIIHPGHLFTLSAAKKLGDLLIVSIARNKTVKKLKNHNPLNGEELRLKLVNALKVVDIALLGSEKNKFEIVERVKPDVIALGYDQSHDTSKLNNDTKRLGFQIKVIRFNSFIDNNKSSNIIKNSKVIEEF